MAIQKYTTYQTPSSLTTGSNMQFKVFDNQVYERHIINSFESAEPKNQLKEFYDSELGKWAEKHCADLEVISMLDYNTAAYKVVIRGYLSPARWVEYLLKFS
jgi:hypothetical protein